MKRILILSFSDLSKDPRVRRHIEMLSPFYEIIAAGYRDPDYSQVGFIQVPQLYSERSFLQKIRYGLSLIIFKRYQQIYWSIEMHRQAYQRLKDIQVDLILANDLDTLPIALRLAKAQHIPVHFDAHEYAPLEFDDLWQWRLIHKQYRHYLCRTYLPQTDSMSTVCEGIAEAYVENYSLKDILVLPNASVYRALSVFPVQSDTIRMIHHGGSIPSRKLEEMIAMMHLLDERFHLDLMLVPNNPEYYHFLTQKAAAHPRIRMLPPINTEDIIPFSNSYDIGLYLLTPINFNHQYALPNKLFEYLQARLAVAIGPSPEMMKIVKKYHCGIVSQDFTPHSLASALQKITPGELQQLKQNADLAAHELSFEKFSQPFLERIHSLLNKPAGH